MRRARQINALVADAAWLKWNRSTDVTAVGEYRVHDTACSFCAEVSNSIGAYAVPVSET